MTAIQLLFVLLITGITSMVSHPLTLVGSTAASITMMLLGILNPSGTLKPMYLVIAGILAIICLLSSETNVAPTSSTIHILSCYSALAGLSMSTPAFSGFVRRTCVLTFIVLTIWIFVQTARAGTIASWTVSGTAGAGNLMAAQLNMMLPLLLVMAFETTGLRKNLLLFLSVCGMGAIICVGSRNGIGSLLITLTLITLFKHIRSAVLICSVLVGVIMMSDELMQLPVIASVLQRFRFVGYRSEAPRSLIWSVCSEYIFKKPWLGIGPGKTEDVLAVMDINHAHNNFVQVAIESGLPAALLVSFLFASLLQVTAAGLLHSRKAFMLSLCVISYLAQSMTDIPLHHPQQTLLLILCVNEARNALRQSADSAVSHEVRPFGAGTGVDTYSSRRDTLTFSPTARSYS